MNTRYVSLPCNMIIKRYRRHLKISAYLVSGEFDAKKDAEGIYHRFIERIMPEFEKYAGNAFDSKIWGEPIFLKHLCYFNGNSNENENADKTGNNNADFKCYLNEEGILPINEDSLNLYINKYQWLNEFEHQITNVKKGCNEETYEMRKQITAFCLATKIRINNAAQFTYMGERFILPEDNWNRKNTDKKPLHAVPFLSSEYLSMIDSVRLIEKIDQFINKEGAFKSSSKSRLLRIAAFGKFADKPENESELHNIEKLAALGYFNEDSGMQNDIKITYFKLVNQGFAMLRFKEENFDNEKSLSGNLYDPSFLIDVRKKFDIICFLDMGCFYTDTNRFLDAYTDNPYEGVRRRMDAIHSKKMKYGVGSISMKEYENLYYALLKWIEKEFYGKKHSFEFDPKLFAVLHTVCGNCSDKPIYTYMSRDRGRALTTVKAYQELCKGEFYNGRAVTVYDWSIPSNVSDLYFVKRYKTLLDKKDTKPMSESKLTIRVWKIIKSMGDSFMWKEFLQMLSDTEEESVDNEPDFDFIKFAKETYLFLDYSALRDKKTVRYNIQYIAPKDSFAKVRTISDEQQINEYLRVVKCFTDGILELAFDPNCYENCASDYCREIIINAMRTDSISIEHLLLTYFMGNGISYKDGIKFIPAEMPIQKIPESEPPILYSLRQKDNLALYDAIASINGTPYGNFNIAAEKLQNALPEADNLKCFYVRDLLIRLHEACEKIGFTSCKLYSCSIQHN